MKGFSCKVLVQIASEQESSIETHGRQINVADHLHGTRNLVCGDKAPALALGRNLIRHLVLFGLEYCRLVKTYS